MKVGIYASIDCGNVHDLSIDYIGVDQGVMHLIRQGIQPLIAIGDMDSIEDLSLLETLPVQKFPAVKDDTDTALAIKYALQQGYDEIDVYGVTKKRMDHFLGVMCLLKKYSSYSITIYDECNKIYVLKPGVHHILKDEYKYFSIFAVKKGKLTLKNCHYPLNDYVLDIDDPLCVSNQMDQEVIIENDEAIIVVQSL